MKKIGMQKSKTLVDNKFYRFRLGISFRDADPHIDFTANKLIFADQFEDAYLAIRQKNPDDNLVLHIYNPAHKHAQENYSWSPATGEQGIIFFTTKFDINHKYLVGVYASCVREVKMREAICGASSELAQDALHNTLTKFMQKHELSQYAVAKLLYGDPAKKTNVNNWCVGGNIPIWVIRFLDLAEKYYGDDLKYKF